MLDGCIDTVSVPGEAIVLGKCCPHAPIAAAMKPPYCTNCGRPVIGDSRCRVCLAPVDSEIEHYPTASLPAVDVELPRIPPVDLGRLIDDSRATGVLVVTRGPSAGARYSLAKETTRVGRSAASDMLLADLSVSRRHAEVRRLGLAYVLADCRSFNGTYVNGRRVDEVALEDLAELKLGRFELTFLAPT